MKIVGLGKNFGNFAWIYLEYAWHPPFCSRKMSCFWILLPNACLRNGSRGISGCELTGGFQSKPTYFPLASWPAPARLILVEFEGKLPRFEGTNHHCPNKFDEKKGVLEKKVRFWVNFVCVCSIWFLSLWQHEHLVYNFNCTRLSRGLQEKQHNTVGP